jgi:hypothetical protein
MYILQKGYLPRLVNLGEGDFQLHEFDPQVGIVGGAEQQTFEIVGRRGGAVVIDLQPNTSNTHHTHTHIKFTSTTHQTHQTYIKHTSNTHQTHQTH